MDFPQTDIVSAIEEELRVSGKPLKFTVGDVQPLASGVFRVIIDSAGSLSRGLDESLEGAAAWWPGPPKGVADVLSVSPEHDQINLRFLTVPPPNKGSELRIYPPRYLEALRDLWDSHLCYRASVLWLQKAIVSGNDSLRPLGDVPEFPELRERQKEAFGLLGLPVGFLWGPPGTGKTYTLGAMLAHFLLRSPRAKVLLLSTTNSAVDLALLSVDYRLEELARVNPAAAQVRKKLKRIGNHFIASNYKDRADLLPTTDKTLVQRIAELETQMPDKNDAVRYAYWKDNVNALRAQIPKPIDQAQLAAMTTTGAVFSYSALLERHPFDLVVFDEASQVSVPHAAILAPLGKSVLFAGDPKQLAPIVQSKHPDARKVLGKSMFEFKGKSNCCFLNEQSRMAEEICEIVSHVFYEGELRVATGCESDPKWRADRRVGFLPGIRTERFHIQSCPEEGTFKPTPYGKGTRSKSAAFVSEVAAACASEIGAHRVLVLTPFRAQRSLIKTLLRKRGHGQIRVSTVHRAQGSECHTVIFDPVIATGAELLGHPEEGPRLINVALSRAEARLVLVLSMGDLANEYLRRIAHAVSGTGQFDEAVPLTSIAHSPTFPRDSIGKVVRWGDAVGPIEIHPVEGHFYINDYVTGARKAFKTEFVRSKCLTAAASRS